MSAVSSENRRGAAKEESEANLVPSLRQDSVHGTRVSRRRLRRFVGAVGLLFMLLASAYGVFHTGQGEPHSYVRDLCANTTWSPGRLSPRLKWSILIVVLGLWLHCGAGCGNHPKAICGGLSNARGRIQTCVRLAMDAGTGLVIPSIVARGVSLTDLAGGANPTCGAETFDIDLLVKNLRTKCPQMPVRACGDWTGIDTELDMPYRSPATRRRSVNDSMG
jgi:hypothetical protein